SRSQRESGASEIVRGRSGRAGCAERQSLQRRLHAGRAAREDMSATGVAGLVLAGGQGRRMGGVDKAFIPLNGKPLIAHVIERSRQQVDQLFISATGDASRFENRKARVLPDDPAFGSAGPLSGLFTALKTLQTEKTPAQWLALFACDTPFFPKDLVARLQSEA